jgi:hypothetical protein
MQSSRTRLDQLVSRLLFIKPSEVTTDESEAQRAFNFSLIFTGVRCTLQYVVLPFILPVIGLAANVALPLLLAINIFAVISMLYSVRRFWQIDYRHKWTYLIMSLVILAALTAFIADDIAQISSSVAG